MARRGGYSRSTDDEYFKTDRQSYAEAILSAAQMGQSLEVWITDAIKFHAYRCEVEQCREGYARAKQGAAASLNPEPIAADYQPNRPRPSFTQSTPSGSGRARGPTPRR